MDNIELNMGPLSVGDQIENFEFNYMQNGKFENGQMDDYRGK